MKKYTALLLSLILAFSCIAVTACGSSKSQNQDFSDSKYVGTWNFSTITFMDESGELDTTIKFVVKADGTGELISEEGTTAFTWEPTDDGFKTKGDVKLTFKDDGERIKSNMFGANLIFEKES